MSSFQKSTSVFSWTDNSPCVLLATASSSQSEWRMGCDMTVCAQRDSEGYFLQLVSCRRHPVGLRGWCTEGLHSVLHIKNSDQIQAEGHTWGGFPGTAWIGPVTWVCLHQESIDNLPPTRIKNSPRPWRKVYISSINQSRRNHSIKMTSCSLSQASCFPFFSVYAWLS